MRQLKRHVMRSNAASVRMHITFHPEGAHIVSRRNDLKIRSIPFRYSWIHPKEYKPGHASHARNDTIIHRDAGFAWK